MFHRRNYEPAAGALATIALFADPHAGDLADDRFGQTADIRMAGNEGYQRAAVALDRVTSFRLFDRSQPAQIAKQRGGSVQPRP